MVSSSPTCQPTEAPHRLESLSFALVRGCLGACLAVLALLLAACGPGDTPPAAPTGALIVQQGPLSGPPSLVSYELDGTEPSGLVPGPDGAAAGRWAPDGQRLLWIQRSADGTVALVVGDPDGTTSSVVATVGAGDTATWAPDCRRLAVSLRDDSTGAQAIQLLTLDASAVSSLDTDVDGASPDWSPSGDVVVFAGDRGGDTDIVVLDLADGTERQLTDNTVGDTGPRWSPDGDRIAWASRVNERKQIFVMGAAGGAKTQLTVGMNGGEHPVWSPDGEWIAYQQAGTALAIMRADGSDHRLLDIVGIPTDWGPPTGSC